MKTRFTQKILMAFLLVGLFTASQAQTYVNGAATGANDGSSWADAYTDLSAALASASGDVWVAAGTYTPTNTDLDTFNTFLISSPMGVYGGFAGTEASIDDRVAGNVTTLSGDMAGDDLDNVFDSNKDDNVFHVVTVDVGATDVVTIDGMTISGGNASDNNDPNDSYIWAGGGLYAVSTVEISNCSFNNNFASSGAGIYLIGDANDSKIDNCLFEKGSATSQCTGAMANTQDGFTVTNCTFRDNTGARGALYPLRTTGLMVDNCTFTNNVNPGGFGGAMFVWNSLGSLTNTTFTGNSAGNAAGIYYDGRETTPGVNNFTFDNLTFSGNTVSGSQGGGIQTFNSSHTMSNCTFENNSAPSFGGGHIDNGEFQTVISNNNTFRNNQSDQVGGGHAFNGLATNYVVTGNTYDSNTSAQWGGAVFSGFGAISSFTDSYFEENASEQGPAGAIWAQNDTTALTVDGCGFKGNTSGGTAGAIGMFGAIPLDINESYFVDNTAEGFGGALNGSEQSEDEPGEATVNITKSIFRENFTGAQGAGFSLIDYDVNIENCEFSGNTNLGEGAGGAMSLNATDTSTVEVNIVHTTMIGNFSVIGCGIASFTGEVDSKLNIKLTNSILANVDGPNYEVEGGTPKFSSLGGNISSDDTTEGAFTNTNDASNIDAEEIFVDIYEFELQPVDGSPAIDIGVDAGVLEDIYGNERVGLPDAGAFEGALVTSNEEVLENDGQLTMSPNPASSIAEVTIENNWLGLIKATVTDMTGKVITNQVVNKTSEKQDFILNVSTFAEGNYILTLRGEDAIVSTQFIKI